MSGGPTIVVKFGAGVATDAFFLVALDDTLNVNVPEGRIIHRYVYKGITYFVIYYGVGDIRTLPADGVKSTFNPGDQVFLLLHYDPAKLRVTDIKSTAGTIVTQGQVSRSASDELLFTAEGEQQTLSHIPAGNIAAAWFGRSATLDRDGLTVTADNGPCLGNISYNYQATSIKYVPPPMNLTGDQTYPVAIVVYVEAA